MEPTITTTPGIVVCLFIRFSTQRTIYFLQELIHFVYGALQCLTGLNQLIRQTERHEYEQFFITQSRPSFIQPGIMIVYQPFSFSDPCIISIGFK